MSTTLKVGDNVMLNSSNLFKMTVSKVDQDQVTCVFWNQGLNKFDIAYFPPACLTIVA